MSVAGLFREPARRWGVPVLIAVCVAEVLLTCCGAWRHYSPVPIGDMWDGFLQNRTCRGISGLADLHNEHRIVFARLLFEVDFHVFGGVSAFLIACNVLLIAATCWVVLRMLAPIERPERWFGALLCAWLFSWAQDQNITWAFQSQFILATLLPLVAFDQAWRASESGMRKVAAIAAGVASCGTMANGLLALPLLAVHALLMRWSWRWILAIVVAVGLTWSWYLHGYAVPVHHGSPLAMLCEHPFQAVLFVLIYLGNPLFFFAGKCMAGRGLAALGGTAVLVVFAWRAWTVWTQRHTVTREHQALDLALLGMAAFVVLSAAVTAAGRLVLGLELATESRYVTPTLLAWAMAALMVAPSLARLDARPNSRLWMLALALAAAMMTYQLRALRAPRYSFDRMVAALALELGVHDDVALRSVVFSPPLAREAAEPYVRTNLSVFGMDTLRDMRESLGRPLAVPAHTGACDAGIDTVRAVPGDPSFLRVDGWFFDRRRQVAASRLAVIDAQGLVCGGGVGGKARSDVAAKLGRAARYSGFSAYVRAPLDSARLALVDVPSGCRVDVALPPDAALGP